MDVLHYLAVLIFYRLRKTFPCAGGRLVGTPKVLSHENVNNRMFVTIVYVWVVSCFNYLKLKCEVYDSAFFRPQIKGRVNTLPFSLIF